MGVEGKLQEWSRLITETLHFCDELYRTNSDPAASSDFASEQAGPWAVQISYAATMAHVHLVAAQAYLDGLAMLVGPSMSLLAFAPVVRSELEALGRASWLLEPGIGARERVERAMTIRMASTQRGVALESAFGHLVDTPETLAVNVDRLEAEAAELGLEMHMTDGRVVNRYFGSTPHPSFTQTVKAIAAELKSTHLFTAGYRRWPIRSSMRCSNSSRPATTKTASR